MAEEIINRVTASGIESIDLDEFFPKEQVAVIDMKEWLFHGLILKEADFRTRIETEDWNRYAGKLVGLTNSADAIVPLWAYMLFVSKLSGIAADIVFGNEEAVISVHYLRELSRLNPEDYRGKRIVIKGCGDYPVPPAAFVEITRILMPVVKNIMYGEPCSTVPVYKKKKE